MAGVRHTDVVVIGAGISGLSAARLLRQHGVQVTVVEASDRVGGRILTIQTDDGNVSDMGGTFVGVEYTRTNALSAEFGMNATLKARVSSCNVYTQGTHHSRPAGPPVFWNPLVNMDINNLYRTIDEYNTKLSLCYPWNDQMAKKLDALSVKQWLDKTIWTRTARRYADHMVRFCTSAEPEEVSLLWFLFRDKSISGIMRVHHGGHAQHSPDWPREKFFKDGMIHFCDKLAQTLNPDSIVLENPVTSIYQNENMISVSTYKGLTIEAEHAILTAPLPKQANISFEPDLSAERSKLIDQVRMGSVIKVYVYYKSPFWKGNGTSSIGMVLDLDLKNPVTATADASSHNNHCLVAYVSGRPAREWTHLTRSERAAGIARCLSRIFNTNEAMQYIDYDEAIWIKEQWIGGGFASTMPPNLLTTCGWALREANGRLHYAGADVASRMNGTIEGAIRTGELAAREILFKMGKIDEKEVWIEEMDGDSRPDFTRHHTLKQRLLPSIPRFLSLVLGLTSGAIVLLFRNNIF